jgi:hypothetical protein
MRANHEQRPNISPAVILPAMDAPTPMESFRGITSFTGLHASPSELLHNVIIFKSSNGYVYLIRNAFTLAGEVFVELQTLAIHATTAEALITSACGGTFIKSFANLELSPVSRNRVDVFDPGAILLYIRPLRDPLSTEPISLGSLQPPTLSLC